MTNLRSFGASFRAHLVALCLLLIATGCVGVDQQRLVSKPSMLFSDSALFADDFKLLLQVEPGSTYGGARAAGCSSCR